MKAKGKIVIEKWDIQIEPNVADVKHQIKDGASISVDAHCLMDADDIVVRSSFDKFLVLDSAKMLKFSRYMQQHIQKSMAYSTLSYDQILFTYARFMNMTIL